MKPDWKVVRDGHQEIIQDVANGRNLAFLACSASGSADSDGLRLAQKVCDYLNSLPPEETICYPHKLESNRQP